MLNTVLIIDDNAEFVTLLQMQLKIEGYVVTSALDPIKGWKEMERCQPDIILVDWEMPEMSGIELIKLIKADDVHRSRYIIMITGHSGTKDIVQGLDAGADDYLRKPFETDELLARIRSGLRIRSLEERISEETKRLTALEMALSATDKIGNPIAAAKIYQQLLMKNAGIANLAEVLNSLNIIGNLLDEALNLINKLRPIDSLKSIPASDGKTMITPE
ncbi:MAG: response regulator transcription factor [Bacteroidota bacterium]